MVKYLSSTGARGLAQHLAFSKGSHTEAATEDQNLGSPSLHQRLFVLKNETKREWLGTF